MIRIFKVVGSVPPNAVADSIYIVRVGVGFDLYVTDVQGVPLKLNGNGEAPPEVVATAPAQFGPDDWSWTPGLEPGQMVLNINNLPSNGGASFTVFRYDLGNGPVDLVGIGTGPRVLMMTEPGASYSSVLWAENSVGPGQISDPKTATAAVVPVPNITSTNGYVNEGDSLTHGYGVSPTYPQYLATQTDLLVLNLGVSGRRLREMNETFVSRGVAGHFNASNRNTMILLAGANEIIHEADTTLEMLQASMLSYANKAKLAGYRLFVCTLPQTNLYNAAKTTLKNNFNTWLKNTFATQVSGIVDVAAVPEFANPSNTTYFTDGTHFTARGHELLAQAVRVATGVALYVPPVVEPDPATSGQYSTNFSEFGVGNLVAPWAHLPGATLGSLWRFADVAGVRKLRQSTAGSVDTGAWTTGPGPAQANIQFYSEGETGFNNAATMEWLIVSGVDMATAPNYRIDFTPSGGSVRIKKGAAGQYSIMATGTATGSVGVNQRVCCLAEFDGSMVRAKIWNKASTEPTAWTVSYVDPTPIPAPFYAGVHNFSGRQPVTAHLMGVGVDGKVAPRAIVAPPISTVNPETDINNLPRVFISTDLKMDSLEKDDAQSLIHALMYQDRYNLVGMCATASKWGIQNGRVQDILLTLDAYEADQAKLIAKSPLFKTAAALRAISYQGATVVAPAGGWSTPTAGSTAINQAATAAIAAGKVLNVLVFGGETDIAQAIHDDPSIVPHIRLFTINKQDDEAFAYILANFRDTLNMWVDNQYTYGGVWRTNNGSQLIQGFHDVHARYHGALGNLFYDMSFNLHGENGVKMGDSPTVFRFLNGNQNDPTQSSWGGQYRNIAGAATTYYTDLVGTETARNTIFIHRAAWLADLQARFDWLL